MTSSPTGASTGTPGPTVAFLGAGSVVFTKDLLHDLLTLPGLDGLTVRLYDIDRERLATAEAIAHRVADQTGTRPIISAHDDVVPAVAGADFCINMVNVGGHPATVTDFEVPARFGLRQTIGDTLGVGASSGRCAPSRCSTRSPRRSWSTLRTPGCCRTPTRWP